MKISDAKKIIPALAAAAVIAFVMYSFLHEDPPEKNRSTEEAEELRSMRLVMSGGRGLDMPDPASIDIETALEGLTRKRLIHDVVIEKNIVCAGEDFEVRVVLEEQDRPGSETVCRLGGKFGTSAVFNYFEPGDRAIDIYARDNQGNVDIRNLAISVIDCPEKTALLIKANQGDRIAEEIKFTIIGKKGIECPCAYEWNFGDGAGQNTTEESISHDFGKRNQDALSSTFIVSVKATGRDGKTAATRTSIALVNTKFVSKQVGFAVVPVIYDTRPEIANGAFSTRVKIKNIYDDAITFNEAELLLKSASTGKIVEQEIVSAGSIMKTTGVTSGEIAEEVITIPSKFIPDQGQVVQVTLLGAFPDTTSAKGMIFLFKK